MTYASRPQDQRRDVRVEHKVPVEVNIGSQFTLQGSLKDLSLKSAFITIKASVCFNVNDEIGFTIQAASGKEDDAIKGIARISRLAPGEGFVIYFTRLIGNSEAHLKKIVDF
ncbi:MAG: PilZ domain-containing protein [Candidatus Omnitrophica bacterium]|nr:PilZ domain-containing protein [Candidatus Omnitrophota bacterium]